MGATKRTVLIVLSSEKFGAVTSGSHTVGKHLLIDGRNTKDRIENAIIQEWDHSDSENIRIILHPTTAHNTNETLLAALTIQKKHNDQECLVQIGVESNGQETFFK